MKRDNFTDKAPAPMDQTNSTQKETLYASGQIALNPTTGVSIRHD
jgi:enamine deaminase RidA (YjgF/YER057c/UK114 family)